MARLFFAIWPDEASRGALAALGRAIAKRCGGRPVAAAKLHLTLLFVGQVDAARVGALLRAAQGTAGCAFRLRLDRVGGFRAAGVAWAGCREAAPELLRLQADLEHRIRGAGFPLDGRTFAPHLTIARHVRAPVDPADVEPISWRAEAFALVESAPGGGAYRTLAEWPLEAEWT